MAKDESWRSTTFYKLGETFERIAVKKLKSIGLSPVLCPGRKNGGADLVVGSTTIEVKGSSRVSAGVNRRKTFCFTLFRNNGRSKNVEEDILLLICRSKPNSFYVIPGKEIQHLTTIKICSDPKKYSGKWNQYKDRFDLIGG